MKKSFLSLLITVPFWSFSQPFSLEKLESLKNFKINRPQFVKASDGIDLAYYAYIPKFPQATLIFYHGAGFYNSALEQNFGKELAEKYSVACYLFDIRGHGNSQGPRGDASSVKQVWDDVTVAIDFVHNKHQDLPLYVGGHSSGAGLVLNYSNYYHNSFVTGYLFIAPFLGIHSGAIKEHKNPSESFVKHVRSWVFILNVISGGYLFGHTPAVYFNYPDEWLKNDPKIVNNYTVTMTAATSPENPQELFSKIDKLFLLIAAENDELFLCQNIIDYKNYVPIQIAQTSEAQIILDTQHLDILLVAAHYCAQFMDILSGSAKQ